MSDLEDVAIERFGSLAALARESGIDERTLSDMAEGLVEPDDAHVRRIRQVVGFDVPNHCFPHARPDVKFLDVSEAKVRRVRDEHLVRPHMVMKDDLVRLVDSRGGGMEKVVGWVKVLDDARWVRTDLVEFTLKDGSVVSCHPAQTVTVARRR